MILAFGSIGNRLVCGQVGRVSSAETNSVFYTSMIRRGDLGLALLHPTKTCIDTVPKEKQFPVQEEKGRAYSNVEQGCSIFLHYNVFHRGYRLVML